MEASPPIRARIGTGVAAMAVAAAFTAAVALGSGTWTWPVAAAGGAGVAVAALALVRGRAGLVGPALVLLAIAYGARLAALDPGLRASAPIAAAALVAVGELAYLSIAFRLPLAQQRGVVARRVALAVIEALGGALVAAVVLTAAGLPAAGGASGVALGVVAAAIALGLVSLLARRRTASR